jgi:hypothetical protein
MSAVVITNIRKPQLCVFAHDLVSFTIISNQLSFGVGSFDCGASCLRVFHLRCSLHTLLPSICAVHFVQWIRHEKVQSHHAASAPQNGHGFSGQDLLLIAIVTLSF